MAAEARARLAAGLCVALAAAAARADVAVPETRLPLRLVGTVVAASPERSLAVIEGGGATRVVRKGQTFDGVRVEQIAKDSIVLVYGSQLERLSFGRASAPSAAAARAEVGRAHGARAADAIDRGEPSRTRRASASPHVASRRPSVQRATFGKAKTNDEVIAEVSRQARFQPLLDDEGKLRGVAVLGIVPDSMLERFGLQSGDVVTHVAGVKIDNTANAFNTLRDLNLANGVELTVLRRGAPTTVNVPPGAF